MHRTITALLLLAALAALLTAAKPQFKVDPGYAARFQTPRGDYMLPALSWLSLAPQAYFRVFGIWPESWKVLRDSGLIQVPLQSPEGYVIDPDDSKWDGIYDTRYVSRGPKQPPLLVTKPDGKTERSEAVSQPAWTIQALLDEQGKLDGEDYGFFSRDENWVKLFAIRSMLVEAVKLYAQQYSRLPDNLGELLQCGLAPVDAASHNPVTGAPFKGDGSAGDLKYETFKARRHGEQVNGLWFRLMVVDGEGRPWRLEP
jgi:hypothetical protein